MFLHGAYSIPKFSKPIGSSELLEKDNDVDVENVNTGFYHEDYDGSFDKLFKQTKIFN